MKTTSKSERPRERLSRPAVPTHYDLVFAPDLERGRVRLRETIHLDVRRSLRTLTLHGVGIEVKKATLAVGGRELEAKATDGKDGQTVRFTFSRSVPRGRARLKLTGSCELRSQLSGMYRARRGDDEFVVTQFEATDARAAFVCLDEPDAKATFSIEAHVPAGWTAYSNEAVVSHKKGRKGGRGKKAQASRFRFAKTRLLPTYLVALCAGPWQETKARDVRGVPVKVVTPRGRLDLAETALDIACAAQAALEDYFGIPYPFGKCDHLAVPDFAAGAMENAGCVTYRETLLLADPGTISIQQLRVMANVITHELAHQWFGNLVTPVWWSDLWLNESFATWMADRILDQLYPEWRVWTSFEMEKASAYHLDALVSTHPIRNDSHRVEEIMQTFDAITYEKGAAVLRMLESYLGEDVMRDGIRRYLRRHADANATGEDLWQALEEAAGKPLKRLLDAWITRPGFPVVRLARRRGRVVLTQERFFSDPERQDKTRRTWRVPVVLRGPGHDEALVLHRKEQLVEVPNDLPWVLANADSGGFYRTRYDRGTLVALVEAFPGLRDAERAGLLGDAWAMARSGRGTVGSVLDLVDRLQGETSQVVLGRAVEIVRRLDDGVVGDGDRAAFRRWAGSVLAPHLGRLGWKGKKGEGDERRLLRAWSVAGLGEICRRPAVMKEARAVAERFLRSPRSVDPELVATVLRLAARGGDEAFFEKLARKQAVAPTPQLERTFLLARCDFERPELIGRMLEATLAEAVRSQDIATVYVRLMQNPAAREPVWTFVQERFEELDARAIWFMWKRIVDALPALGTERHRREVAAFFRAHPLADTDRAIAQADEAFAQALAFRRRARPQVARWLKAR